jgi:hypothetical protein
MLRPRIAPRSAGPGYPSFRLPAVLLAALLPAAVVAAEDDWKYDVVHLKNGHTLRGLLVEQTPAVIQFRCVSRKPGSHTLVIPETLQRAEVSSVELLPDRERETLAARLRALDPTGKGEAQRMASLELTSVPWGKGGNGKALRYESTHFVLGSDAPEDVVRRAAVQLEQVFAAYVRFLPPRARGGQPTAILLAQSLGEYQALLKEQGRVLLNPALYDPRRNQIVCGTDLRQLGEQLERTRRRHQQLLREAKEREAELNRLFKGQVPAQLLRPIHEVRADVDRVNRQNDEQFQAATRQLFGVLYHEAFHAYLANFVYPPDEASVPRWLNEGLAQVFETAFVEAGELRVGHADKARLTQAQAALARGELVPLRELLRSGPGQFVVQHASEQRNSDRYYLTSWAVAFYLTFDRRLLGTRAMDDYVRALHGGEDPLAAFRRLAGQGPTQFEEDFQAYLALLRPDGTVPRK